MGCSDGRVKNDSANSTDIYAEGSQDADQAYPIQQSTSIPAPTIESTHSTSIDTATTAKVLSVRTSGVAGAYQFSVELESPDTGCQQYADWWEIIDGDGNLIYRRVLAHSHVNEQPFTRSGGPVIINGDQIVWIRVHMNNSGYSSNVLKGSVQGGFNPTELSPSYADHLVDEQPLPAECGF